MAGPPRRVAGIGWIVFMFHVYVLKSEKNGRRYIGLTEKSPDERLREHNSGASAYTRRNLPFILIYTESYKDSALARKRERFFKSGRGRHVLKSILEKNL